MTSGFRRAGSGDAQAIAALVNAANSGDGGTAGWTHEAGLFEGERIDASEVLELLAVPGAMFLLCVRGGEVAGCAYLKRIDGAGYMGLLAVRPTLQQGGVGKEIIAECERVVREEWRCGAMRISVITRHRPELAAFYERRGYARTGRFKDFERKQALKVEGLALEWMEKRLA